MGRWFSPDYLLSPRSSGIDGGSQIYAETEPELFYTQGRLLLIVAASTADEKPERELHERSPKPNR